MKSESDVKKKIAEFLGVELDRRVREAGERLPFRCTHNHRQPLDARKTVGGERNPNYNRISQVSQEGVSLSVVQTIGLCMLDEPGKHLTICEDPLDAKRCPFFCASEGKEQLLQGLTEQLQDPEWVEANMPEVHALLWVLNEMGRPQQLQLSWWKKIWFRFVRIQVEPVLPAFDPAKLLGPASSDEPSVH